MARSPFSFRIGSLVWVEAHGSGGWTVRVPWIGEAFVGQGMSAWSSWRALRRTGAV